jgi:hypothetical protein
MTPGAILRLMAYAQLSPRVKLGPEDRVCGPFATMLRAATIKGSLRAVWTHPANELAGQPGKNVRAAVARALGLIPGTGDYLFLWADGAGVLEAKSADGRMNPNQKDFRAWCEANGVRYAVFRTPAEGEAVLREWGILT